MTDYNNLVISALDNTHDRPNFQYGNDQLDNYLKKQAKQDIKRRISRVFIATLPEEPATVVGYYTLSSLSIELDQLPEETKRKLPKHPIPGALIGRLAVSKDAQGQGIGRLLLADAIKRTLAVSQEIAIYTIVVDAIDKQAASFYRQYGFSTLVSHENRLYLPLKSF